MQAFLLRHGEAQLFAETDRERALTSLGHQQTLDILSRSAGDLSRVTRIIASPYIRAQQTAQLAAEQLELPVETSDLLTPDSRLMPLGEFVESLQDDIPLLVTHQPLVGSFVDWLCGLAPGRHIMGTSALAYVEADVMAGSCGELLWLHQPDY
ncbi:phosphohistidine phosphatase SixA [Pseudomaricurvus alkylphenolicus]|jgi:phosphohistidine phosphatase SixA|uniref:phosphohistidine phosphatase SixA n=1 Tax=Pseudomaricurvus alkylphenolicus TaxID=1306991 RepID=UPI001423C059|nr:phosphohistidine phosphatase SixA [Pseudomaricurvus alkylphenolicus]NIB41348.1 phosphohistidine phosphatase SixA [Pseudomaricurvus alkylphenolicus]